MRSSSSSSYGNNRKRGLTFKSHQFFIRWLPTAPATPAARRLCSKSKREAYAEGKHTRGPKGGCVCGEPGWGGAGAGGGWVTRGGIDCWPNVLRVPCLFEVDDPADVAHDHGDEGEAEDGEGGDEEPDGKLGDAQHNRAFV